MISKIGAALLAAALAITVPLACHHHHYKVQPGGPNIPAQTR